MIIECAIFRYGRDQDFVHCTHHDRCAMYRQACTLVLMTDNVCACVHYARLHTLSYTHTVYCLFATHTAVYTMQDCVHFRTHALCTVCLLRTLLCTLCKTTYTFVHTHTHCVLFVRYAHCCVHYARLRTLSYTHCVLFVRYAHCCVHFQPSDDGCAAAATADSFCVACC